MKTKPTLIRADSVLRSLRRESARLHKAWVICPTATIADIKQGVDVAIGIVERAAKRQQVARRSRKGKRNG